MVVTRRAKIVCTLGPSTADPETVRALVEAGMDVARINLSYGSSDEHRDAVHHVRRAAEQAGRTVAVLADLRGPKLRTGTFATGSADLRTGEPFVLTISDTIGSSGRVSMGPPEYLTRVAPGDRILLRDGRVALEVTDVALPEIRTTVISGGEVTDNAGVTLPDAVGEGPAVTDQDARDLGVVLAAGVDLVALSFVTRAEDAAAVRRLMDDAGRSVPVIAKIERSDAVERLEEVTQAFDGLMVARGDLGIEMPLEEVPLLQKRAITTARRWARPAIVATEMLESMISASRPTRAEASDVANAVLDGADALMLSGETAVGSHPAEVVRVMARIIEAAERDATYPDAEDQEGTRDDAVARAAVQVASRIGACSIVVFTESGTSARRVARHRAAAPIWAFTPHRAVASQLALTWGVHASVLPHVSTTDEMVRQVERTLVAGRGLRDGDDIVIVAGTPMGVTGSTNMIRVHTIGTR